MLLIYFNNARVRILIVKILRVTRCAQNCARDATTWAHVTEAGRVLVSGYFGGVGCCSDRRLLEGVVPCNTKAHVMLWSVIAFHGIAANKPPVSARLGIAVAALPTPSIEPPPAAPAAPTVGCKYTHRCHVMPSHNKQAPRDLDQLLPCVSWL